LECQRYDPHKQAGAPAATATVPWAGPRPIGFNPEMGRTRRNAHETVAHQAKAGGGAGHIGVSETRSHTWEGAPAATAAVPWAGPRSILRTPEQGGALPGAAKIWFRQCKTRPGS